MRVDWTPKLAMYIRIDDTPDDEEDRIEQQRIQHPTERAGVFGDARRALPAQRLASENQSLVLARMAYPLLFRGDYQICRRAKSLLRRAARSASPRRHTIYFDMATQMACQCSMRPDTTIVRW